MKSVVLLRGINVGGHGKLPMKQLCGLLEGLGAQNPQSYIQSGNVVIDGSIGGEAIADAIMDANSFRPQVMVFSATEFRKAIAQVPINEPIGKLTHIWFTKMPFIFDHTKADRLIDATETLHVTEKTIILHAPKGIGRSKLVAKIEALAGVPCTARNMNTVNKLVEMLDGR